MNHTGAGLKPSGITSEMVISAANSIGDCLQVKTYIVFPLHTTVRGSDIKKAQIDYYSAYYEH